MSEINLTTDPRTAAKRGNGFLIFLAVIIYCIAGAALFSFIPDTIDWLCSAERQTVLAEVISSREEYFGSDTSSDSRSYSITLQYVADDTKYTHTYYAKHVPSGRKKLHIYRCSDGHWEVFPVTIGSLIFYIGIAAAAAIFGTRLLRYVGKRRKLAKSA